MFSDPAVPNGGLFRENFFSGNRKRNIELGVVYKRKLVPTRVSYQDDFLISYRVYMMTGPFHISLFEGTLHVDKIHVLLKIANITHALPVPVYRQTDYTPKRVVASRLHDTVARFRTGVKFSPRYNSNSFENFLKKSLVDQIAN